MVCSNLKKFIHEKKRQWIVHRRVINFKKKISKLQKEKDELKRKYAH